MTRDEVRKLLVMRRDLSGETFNDGTIDAWSTALAGWGYDAARQALVKATSSHDRVTVYAVAEQRRQHRPYDDNPHPVPPQASPEERARVRATIIDPLRARKGWPTPTIAEEAS